MTESTATRKLIRILDGQTTILVEQADAEKALAALGIEREGYQGYTIIDTILSQPVIVREYDEESGSESEREETESSDAYSDFCSRTSVVENEQPGDEVAETWVYREDLAGGVFVVA